jgi:hypothetical protein
MNPYHHAVSSARLHQGKWEDYIAIHEWFDESKKFFADWRHRALRHHAQGIYECQALFGHTITNSDGKVIPVRFIGEQHVREDLGFIPSLQDWLKHIQRQDWMNRSPAKNGVDLVGIHEEEQKSSESSARVHKSEKINIQELLK